MNLLSLAGTAKAFAVNFWPWLLGAFLVGAGVSGYAAHKVTRAFDRSQIAEARQQLADFKTDLATATSEGERAAAARQAEALAALKAKDTATSEAVAAIPAQVAAMLAPRFTALRESLNAPQFDCLRQPLPDSALQLLARPAGVAPATH